MFLFIDDVFASLQVAYLLKCVLFLYHRFTPLYKAILGKVFTWFTGSLKHVCILKFVEVYPVDMRYIMRTYKAIII